MIGGWPAGRWLGKPCRAICTWSSGWISARSLPWWTGSDTATNAEKSMISLVRRCHEALMKTRGVVMTLASLNGLENTLTWMAVGNVEGRLLRRDERAAPASESVLLRGGLVGYQLPGLHTSVVPIAPGDLLILATDGVRPGFADGVNVSQTPGQLAGQILSEHFKGTDDALVLVARYLGMHHE